MLGPCRPLSTNLQQALHWLIAKSIITMEDLAEQAVDDLMDIDDMDEEKAAALIMTARASWFAEESSE